MARISPASQDALSAAHPLIGLRLMQALGRVAGDKLREATHRLAAYAVPLQADAAVDAMVTRASAAQQTIEAWPEQRIDALLGALAETLAGHARELAEAAVRETGLGNEPDKVIKNRLASLGVYQRLAGRPAVGIIGTDEQRRLLEVASPVEWSSVSFRKRTRCQRSRSKSLLL